MSWSYQSLWEKAKRYSAHANGVGHDQPLYAFWSSLVLEFLARATLANLNPVLLADCSKDGGLENLLYAIGSPKNPTKSPKSVGIWFVYERCQYIYPDKFSKEDVSFCKLMTEQRNSELHSGEKAFEKWPNNVWLARYYRACSNLLLIQGKAMADLFDKDEAVAAQKMIDGMEEKFKGEAERAIATAKTYFEALSEEKKAELRSLQEVGLHNHPESVPCPACGIPAMRWGDTVHLSKDRLKENMIAWDVSILPSKFECNSCKLKLDGYGLLDAAGIGGQFSFTEEVDPMEYYSDPTEYYNDQIEHSRQEISQGVLKGLECGLAASGWKWKMDSEDAPT